MSYIVTYAIQGYDISFCDGNLLIPSTADFDDPAYVEALKFAASVAPGLDIILRLKEYSKNPSYLYTESDQFITWACESANLITNQTFFTVPSEVLAVCEWAKIERRRRDEKRAWEEQQQERRRARARGYVYLLRSETGHYKIGKTKDPENRLATFSVKLPFPVAYEHVIATPDMASLEKSLHLQFEHRRINGEWFVLDDDEIAYIKSLDGEA
jgi:hypothetical protein